jgi:glycosyltransferase involved in cell wall biosynthesis
MRILFVIPGDINLPTGGYRYDKEIINAWKASGIDVELISLEGNYPFPSEQDKANALKAIEKFPDAKVAVVDGLLGGASPEFMQALSKIMPVTALIHHPLCLENGLDENTAQNLKVSEQKGLEFVSQIITTSPATTKTVSQLFGVESTKTHTVLPGVKRTQVSKGSQSETVHLLCVGSVIERKGHKFLLHSLSRLKDLNWRLDCYGSTEFDTKLFDELQSFVKAENMSEKVAFHGAVSDEMIEAAYTTSDVFVLPSLFEGYGMVYAEAIVRGLPIIASTAGAIPDTVPQTCGILVEPENTNMLTQALEQMISNEHLRNNYRQGAMTAAEDFPTWQGSATQFRELLKDMT